MNQLSIPKLDAKIERQKRKFLNMEREYKKL